MKYNFCKVLILSALIFSSCAKDESLNITEITSIAWSKYIRNSYWTLPPSNSAITEESTLYQLECDTTVFYNIIDQSAVTDNTTPQSEEWVKVKYTGYNMQGGVFATRDSLEAVIQQTWTTVTNYNAQTIKIVDQDTEYSDVPEGLLDMFANMRVGEKVRAYIPYSSGWGTSGVTFSSGYEGRYSLGYNENFFMDIELVEIIPDIEEWEKEQVKNYVAANFQSSWNGIGSDDDLLYYRVIEDEFRGIKLLENGVDTTYTSSDLGVEIDDSKTVQIYYSLWTLDGFLVDTNIKSDAVEHWQFEEYVGFYPAFSTASSTDEFVDAIKEVVYEQGTTLGSQWCEAIFTSAWGYGDEGLSSSEIKSFEYSDDLLIDIGDDFYWTSYPTAIVELYQPLRVEFLARVYVDED
ncbi:MAG: FKBP-type peptidyl-prolyl cis-trans isomerase [Rikenellaceae bacterium]